LRGRWCDAMAAAYQREHRQYKADRGNYRYETLPRHFDFSLP